MCAQRLLDLFAVVSLALNVACLPLLVFPRPATIWAANNGRGCCCSVSAHRGTQMEVRGTAPQRSRPHRRQAFQHVGNHRDDRSLRRTAIVIKRELFSIPLYGWYSIKQGMIPIDRSGGASAIQRMHEAAKRATMTAADRHLPRGNTKEARRSARLQAGCRRRSMRCSECPAFRSRTIRDCSGWAGSCAAPGPSSSNFSKPIAAGRQARELSGALQVDMSASFKPASWKPHRAGGGRAGGSCIYRAVHNLKHNRNIRAT